MTPPVELTVHSVTAMIQSSIDSIAPAIQSLGCAFVPGCIGPIAGSVQTPVDHVTAPVEASVDPIPLAVEPRLDAVATSIQLLTTRRIVGERTSADDDGREPDQ